MLSHCMSPPSIRISGTIRFKTLKRYISCKRQMSRLIKYKANILNRTLALLDVGLALPVFLPLLIPMSCNFPVQIDRLCATVCVQDPSKTPNAVQLDSMTLHTYIEQHAWTAGITCKTKFHFDLFHSWRYFFLLIKVNNFSAEKRIKYNGIKVIGIKKKKKSSLPINVVCSVLWDIEPA